MCCVSLLLSQDAHGIDSRETYCDSFIVKTILVYYTT